MRSNLYAAKWPGNALLRLSLAPVEEIASLGHQPGRPAILEHGDYYRTGQLDRDQPARPCPQCSPGRDRALGYWAEAACLSDDPNPSAALDRSGCQLEPGHRAADSTSCSTRARVPPTPPYAGYPPTVCRWHSQIFVAIARRRRH